MSVWTHYIPRKIVSRVCNIGQVLVGNWAGIAIWGTGRSVGGVTHLGAWIVFDSMNLNTGTVINLVAYYDLMDNTWTYYHINIGTDGWYASPRPIYVDTQSNVYIMLSLIDFDVPHGAGGRIFHWDGISWGMERSTPTGIADVFGTAQDVWVSEMAVTVPTLSNWFIETQHYYAHPTPPPTPHWEALQEEGGGRFFWFLGKGAFYDPTVVYIAGLAYDGGTNAIIKVDYVTGLASKEDVTVLGSINTGYRMFYAPTSTNVWGAAQNIVDVVIFKTISGWDYYDPSPLFYSGSGAQVGAILTDGHGISSTDVYICGYVAQEVTGRNMPLIIHWDGTSWTNFFPFTWLDTTMYYEATLASIHVYNDDTIWVAGTAFCPDSYPQAFVMITTDGGTTWVDISPPPWVP